MTEKLPQAIEAILFATAEPQTFKMLASRLETTEESIREAVGTLQSSYLDRGISLSNLNDTVTLVTSSEFSQIIENIRKEELSKELSKASAETLAVISYMPGVSKSQIEFIRGVNVSYSLRSLQMRGLIEAKGNGRGVSYHPTLQLLEHFGVASLEHLPNYIETKNKIESLLNNENKSE